MPSLPHTLRYLVHLPIVALLLSCGDDEERRTRYAEKKPPPKQQQIVIPVRGGNMEGGETTPNKKQEVPSYCIYNGKDFEQLIGISGRQVLLFFVTPWCLACKRQQASLQAYAEKNNGKVLIVEINADQHPTLAKKYELRAVPKVVIYVEGMRLRSMSGALSPERFQEEMDALLSPPKK